MNVVKLNHTIWNNCEPGRIIRSSLVICTYKRPQSMLKFIKHLELLDDIPGEIVIVDGSQDNKSYDLLAPLFSEGILSRRIIYVFAPTGLTIQRNAGIDVSCGEIIHFLDDDCLPEPHYFSEIEEVFRMNHDVGGITGAILNEMGTPVSKKYIIRRFLGLYPSNGIPGKYYCNGSSVPKSLLGTNFYENLEIDNVSGASMSFRRSIINKVDGFSEFFQGYSHGEDAEFSLRVRSVARIMLCRSAECNHYHEKASRPDLFKKGFMEIFNRYYIWKLYVKKKSLKCRYQFWGDVLLMNLFSCFQYIGSGLRFNQLKYCLGVFSGTVKALFVYRVEVYKRTVFFKVDSTS